MCKTLRVSRSGFYGWFGRDESDRARDDRRLTALIHGIFDESRKTYGAPPACIGRCESAMCVAGTIVLLA